MSDDSITLSVTKNLRPLRIGFLTDYKNKKSLLEFFEISTRVWGGIFNPLMPFFNRTPTWWKKDMPFLQAPSSKEIFDGYFDAFEPDYLAVSSAEQSDKKIDDKERFVIKRNEILPEHRNGQCCHYSVDINHLYEYLYEKEFKYVLRRKPNFFLPIPESNDDKLFIACCFGQFSNNEHSQITSDNFKEVFDAKETVINSQNFFDLIVGNNNINPLKITLWDLTVRRSYNFSRFSIFIMNHKSPEDLVDFWNLRALGWKVIPVPIAWLETSKTVISKFIIDRQGDKKHPQASRPISIMKARSVDKNEFESISKLLPAGLSYQNWYPRVWNTTTREYDHGNRSTIIASQNTEEIPTKRSFIAFNLLAPEFHENRHAITAPSWANSITFKNNNSDKNISSFFPPDLLEINQLLHASYEEPLTSTTEGITVRGGGFSNRVYWNLPDGTETIKFWLQKNYIESEVSQPGRLAFEMFRSLGGMNGIRIIDDQKIINLLRKNTSSSEEWLGTLKRTNRNNLEVAKRHLELFFNKSILKAGLKITCPHCNFSNWFSLKILSDHLLCERCEKKFPFPSHSPTNDAKWFYKANGPFSSSEESSGNYCVLLLLKFLTHNFNRLEDSIWVPGINLEKSNTRKEIDLLIWKKSSFLNQSDADLILCECKSNQEFKNDDFQRAKWLAEHFPTAVITFATLRNELKPGEIKQLKKIAQKGRNLVSDKKWKNPVLILTANELFSERPVPNCWKNKGGKFEKFSKSNIYITSLNDLCDITQQLYLNMEPVSDTQKKIFEKKYGQKKKRPN
ncbi:MAG: hypothetical protein R2877_07350 [Bdellovibrionota bacterium]